MGQAWHTKIKALLILHSRGSMVSWRHVYNELKYKVGREECPERNFIIETINLDRLEERKYISNPMELKEKT